MARPNPIPEPPSQGQAEDFPLERVPEHRRLPWYTVTVMRFGQLSALSQFLLGATLGFGMTFWNAFLAFTLGAVILEVVAIISGIIGQREGLQTSLLARWTGFGEVGSGILGLVIGVSVIGWFGVQNAVFASGLQQIVGGLPFWAWAVLSGIFIMIIVYYGVLTMGWTAYVAVPLFVLVILYSMAQAFRVHPLGALVASAAPGPIISVPTGATIVAGGFIIGGVISPDMTRFNRSARDVAAQTLIGITVGEYTVGMIGVLLAHALKSNNIITLVLSTSGLVGTLVLITGTMKINDWNLYDSSLGIVNSIELIFRTKISRRKTTLVAGAFGTILSALGILTHFESFLGTLGVAIPPVASIMIVDYFLLNRQRTALEQSRLNGRLPRRVERVNYICLASWVIGFLVGQFLPWGIGSVNSLLAAAIVYYVTSRIVFGAHTAGRLMAEVDSALEA